MKGIHGAVKLTPSATVELAHNDGAASLALPPCPGRAYTQPNNTDYAVRVEWIKILSREQGIKAGAVRQPEQCVRAPGPASPSNGSPNDSGSPHDCIGSARKILDEFIDGA